MLRRHFKFLTMTETASAQQTQTFCITFVQRRPNVFDVGPTLYKCYTNVVCLLGMARVTDQHRNHIGFDESLHNHD